MTKLSAIALAAALAASMPMALHAQDAGVGADVGAEVDAGVDAGADVSVDANADATDSAGADADAAAMSGADVQYTYANLQTALGTEFDFETITPETPVTIVPLSQLDDEGDMSSDAMIRGESAFAGSISRVQTELAGNAEVELVLDEAGYTVDDVVALWMGEDMSVIVFVDDVEA